MYPMEFPPFVRLHEKMVYKDPGPGVYIAQPFGKQCYVWFTDHCYMVDIQRKHKNIISIKFDPSLQGTLVLGTIVYHEQKKYILIYDMFYYKNQEVTGDILHKWKLMTEMLYMHVYPSEYTLMLPLMSPTPTTFTPDYQLYSIKVVTPTMVYHWMKQTKPNVYTVRSTSKSDIYTVHHNNEFLSYACIDTLKRSEMMNALFHTDMEHKMECKWNEKFKKWIPLKLN
jgi:hypothetical protein